MSTFKVNGKLFFGTTDLTCDSLLRALHENSLLMLSEFEMIKSCPTDIIRKPEVF